MYAIPARLGEARYPAIPAGRSRVINDELDCYHGAPPEPPVRRTTVVRLPNASPRRVRHVRVADGRRPPRSITLLERHMKHHRASPLSAHEVSPAERQRDVAFRSGTVD